MATNSPLNSEFSNAHFLEVANRAVAKAIETHRRLGQSIVVMRDGKITWLSPDEIPALETNELQRHRDTEKS